MTARQQATPAALSSCKEAILGVCCATNVIGDLG